MINVDKSSWHLKKPRTYKKRCHYDLISLIKVSIYGIIIISYNWYCYNYFTEIRKSRCSDGSSFTRGIEKATRKKVESDECAMSDMNCYNKFWKGDALKTYPKNETLDVSVVISYCGEDMDVFNDYINDWKAKISVRSTTIICRCSKSPTENIPKNAHKIISEDYNYPDLNFMSWLASQMTSSSSSSDTNNKQSKSSVLLSAKHNHIILFLNSKSIQENAHPRNLRDVLHSTLENGFGCVQRPHSQSSLYHNSKKLTSFAPASSKLGPYTKFGDWLDQLSISSMLTNKELVPVCYSSSFAIKSSDVLSQSKLFHPIIKSIEYNLKHINNSKERTEVHEFVERLWASIFSYPLETKQISLLKKYVTSVFEDACCTYTGSLLHDFRKSNFFSFLKGDTLQKEQVNYSKLRLTLVVSHCREDLKWMNKFMQVIPIQTTFIFSKCLYRPSGYSPPNTTEISLPNIGRNDHTYARWMNQMEEKDATDNHIVLFFVASRDQTVMTFRSIEDMIRIALSNGFACGAEHANNEFAYHDTDTLRSFALGSWHGTNIKSKYDNMGQWLDDIDVQLPNPFSNVCYSGSFAAKASVIYSKKNIWNKIEQSLSRDDNIEEGHFAERAWAGLLTYPMNPKQIDMLKSLPTMTQKSPGHGYLGYLAYVMPEGGENQEQIWSV